MATSWRLCRCWNRAFAWRRRERRPQLTDDAFSFLLTVCGHVPGNSILLRLLRTAGCDTARGPFSSCGSARVSWGRDEVARMRRWLFSASLIPGQLWCGNDHAPSTLRTKLPCGAQGSFKWGTRLRTVLADATSAPPVALAPHGQRVVPVAPSQQVPAVECQVTNDAALSLSLLQSEALPGDGCPSRSGAGASRSGGALQLTERTAPLISGAQKRVVTLGNLW